MNGVLVLSCLVAQVLLQHHANTLARLMRLAMNTTFVACHASCAEAQTVLWLV